MANEALVFVVLYCDFLIQLPMWKLLRPSQRHDTIFYGIFAILVVGTMVSFTVGLVNTLRHGKCAARDNENNVLNNHKMDLNPIDAPYDVFGDTQDDILTIENFQLLTETFENMTLDVDFGHENCASELTVSMYIL